MVDNQFANKTETVMTYPDKTQINSLYTTNSH